MATFHHMPLEIAPPARARVLEHVERLLDGHDTGLVGTIAANLMIDVILTEIPDGDLAKVDAFIDEYAAALKEGARRCFERRKH